MYYFQKGTHSFEDHNGPFYFQTVFQVIFWPQLMVQPKNNGHFNKISFTSDLIWVAVVPCIIHRSSVANSGKMF